MDFCRPTSPNARTGTLQYRAQVAIRMERLRPGQFAGWKCPVASASAALLFDQKAYDRQDRR